MLDRRGTRQNRVADANFAPAPQQNDNPFPSAYFAGTAGNGRVNQPILIFPLATTRRLRLKGWERWGESSHPNFPVIFDRRGRNFNGADFFHGSLQHLGPDSGRAYKI